MKQCSWRPTLKSSAVVPARLSARYPQLFTFRVQNYPLGVSHVCQCAQRELQAPSVLDKTEAQAATNTNDNEDAHSATAQQSQSSFSLAEQQLPDLQQQPTDASEVGGSAPLLGTFQKLAATALLISPFFFWGTSMVAMKEVLPHATPLLISTLRLLPAGVVLVAWAAATGRPQPQTPVAWAWITAFALVDAAAFQGFLAEGLQRTSAGLGSVIIDSQPLSVAVLAAILFGEQLKPAGIAGLFIGVAGLLMLELPPDDLDFITLPLQTALHLSPSLTDNNVLQSAVAAGSVLDVSSVNSAIDAASLSTAALAPVPIDVSTTTTTLPSGTSTALAASFQSSASSVSTTPMALLDASSSTTSIPAKSWSLWDSGEWWMLLAAQSMAVGTVMVRGVAKHADPFIATGWHMILGGLMLLGFITATDAPSIGNSLGQFQTEDVLAMAYVSLLGGAASYGVFFDNATRGNLTALSSLTFLTPMFAAGAGFLLLNETLTPLQLTGAGVTLSAVYLINK